MAKVELPPGIAAIHGKLGNMIFRSRKQADGSYKVFVHEYRGMKGERLEARGERKKKGERLEARGKRAYLSILTALWKDIDRTLIAW